MKNLNIKLENVGSIFNTKTKLFYPQLKNGKPDLVSGFSLAECSDEFKEKLNYKDIGKYFDFDENIDLLPENIRDILCSYNEDTNNPYLEAARIIKELEKNDFTADYDLSGAIFDIEKL
jgi:hypothetical protein